MVCPSCGTRKGRRECPALRSRICTICCGTKRLVEIACPADCIYLSSAREHPAAVVRKQQERDVAAVFPAISHLTERQHQLFFLFHSVVARHKPEGFGRLIDEDVAEAARAVASTLETAVRGVLYEHSPTSATAQRLARELTAMLAEMRSQGAKVYDGEAAIALRAVERAAREVRKSGAQDDAYISLMARLLRTASPQYGEDGPAKPAGTVILP
jgi:hypothetical protein